MTKLISIKSDSSLLNENKPLIKGIIMRLLRPIIFSILLYIVFSCSNESPQSPINDSGDFIVASGDIEIAGTIDYPTNDGPYPVIIVIPGSGKRTREDTKVAVDIFVPQGIAVLRYDKRGVGKSTGIFEGPGAETSVRIFDDLASDILALIEFLKTVPEIDAQQIGLFGSSQGAWIVPLVAAQSSDVAFTICSSGATNTVGISDYYDLMADDSTSSIESIISKLPEFNGVHGFDPLAYLKQMIKPGLWLYGGEDRSNPTHADIEILEELIDDFDKDFTILLFPFSDHELIDIRTNEPDPELIPSLIDWIVKQISNP